MSRKKNDKNDGEPKPLPKPLAVVRRGDMVQCFGESTQYLVSHVVGYKVFYRDDEQKITELHGAIWWVFRDGELVGKGR